MVKNQLHGKKFEDQIKGSGRFPGAADHTRAIDAPFDIEARFDRELGLPTSIKAMGRGTVALADARRFWRIEEPFRMLVGSYVQLTDRKRFERVHEFLIGVDWLPVLLRAVTLEEVTELHEGMGLAAFPRGRHVQARIWAAQRLALLNVKRGAVRLNRKIDSAGQRRLQCSVPLSALLRLAEERPDFAGRGGERRPSYRLHDERIGDLYLPIVVHGSAREFN